jgi:hypothetical protein
VAEQAALANGMQRAMAGKAARGDRRAEQDHQCVV